MNISDSFHDDIFYKLSERIATLIYCQQFIIIGGPSAYENLL